MTRTIDAARLLRWLQDQEDEILEANTGHPADRTAASTIREIRAKVEAMAAPPRPSMDFSAALLAVSGAKAPYVAVAALIAGYFLAVPPCQQGKQS